MFVYASWDLDDVHDDLGGVQGFAAVVESGEGLAYHERWTGRDRMFLKNARMCRRAGLAGVLVLLVFCPSALASTSVYVANAGANTVSQFTVAANGTLSPKTPATVATGTGPAVALSADGKSAYVTNIERHGVAVHGRGERDAVAKTPATVATATPRSGSR